jgi:tripartite-type tricarboxylate transporter receptor subunit TctC
MKIVFTLLVSLFLGFTAQAQDYPIKTIRIVVPYSPGGGTDTVARLMAAHISNSLGQQVIVENKAGASANIGTEFVAKAPADGYTILVTAPNFTTSEALFDKLGWRFDDFIPLIHLARYGNFLVAAPGTPFTSLEQMIARAKSAPGALSFGSAGTGSNSHLAMELLAQRAAINVPHIPYKGSGPLKVDLLGSHLPLGVDGLGGLSELIRSGKLKPLAVLASKRSSLAPEIPSLGDFGIQDVDGNGWYGALLPAGTPAAVVNKLHSAFAAALNAPEIKDRMTTIGVEPVGGSKEDFKNYLTGERRKWAQVISTAKIKVD